MYQKQVQTDIRQSRMRYDTKISDTQLEPVDDIVKNQRLITSHKQEHYITQLNRLSLVMYALSAIQRSCISE